ncbi:hypothetical protein [Streptomyces sp. NPDC088739]|uniref:hypothetical protein n=1 Tax=Streptomyces sp. NPDC088739 TaxID=3365882 RepID=UPI0037F310AF
MTTPSVFVPRTPVPPPPPAPPRYTLLGAISQGTTDREGHWQRGVEYYSTSCNRSTGYVDGWCPPVDDDGNPTDWDKPVEAFNPSRVEGVPFTITSGVECHSPVFAAQTEAEAALARGEDLQVEQRFWAHQMQRPDLVEIQPGVAVGLDEAIGYLEEEAAVRYTGQIYIHVPIRAVSLLGALRLVSPDRNVLRTTYGSVVVPGAGYKDQTGPGGKAKPASGWWFLATGQPVYRRSEVFAHEAFEPRSNRRGSIAERTYVITGDCVALAIQAAPCVCTPTPPPTP